MPPDAIEIAEKRNLNIFRLDVSAAIGALIQKLLETEQIVDKKFVDAYFMKNLSCPEDF